MKRHGTWPWFDRTFEKGASQLQGLKILARADGYYYDLRNAIPDKESPGRLRKIKGEEILYPSIDNSSTNDYSTPYYTNFATGKWKCTAAIRTQVGATNYIFECWMDQNGVLDSFIRVNGTIYCASPDLVFNSTMDITEDGTGNVFLTNNETNPIYFNIQDLIDNSGTANYYSNFILSANYIAKSSPNNFPRFIALTKDPYYTSDESFTGTTGFNVGSVAYQIRYGTDGGEFSDLSHSTPLIPIPLHLSDGSDKFPSHGTAGADPGTETTVGVVLKFRVNNVGDYDFIQIIRHEYEGGLPIGYTPQVGIIVGSIAIDPQEISSYTIVDYKGDEGSVTIEEDAGAMTAINKAKAIKYHNNRLWMFNVELAERELENTEGLIRDWGEDGTVIPVLKNLGKRGYSDIKNSVYNTQYMSGEKYGFVAVFFDSGYTKSFAVPIDLSKQMPDRRDRMEYLSKVYSDVGPVAASKDGVVRKVYERFDNTEDTRSSIGLSVTDKIFPPTGSSDPADGLDPTFVSSMLISAGGYTDYNPKCWGSNMFAQGVMINSIDQSLLPDWVESFTIARTAPAGRVITQGLGAYSFKIGEGGQKNSNTHSFFSPELMSYRGLSTDSIIDFIRNNATAQFVSPLGFSTHPVLAYKLTNASSLLDIIIRANVIHDTGTINPSDNGMGIDNYVAFGKYRNTPSLMPSSEYFDFNEGAEGDISISDGIIGISDFSEPSSEIDLAHQGRGSRFNLQYDEDIYGPEAEVQADGFLGSWAKEYTHPMYTVNILNESAAISSADTLRFLDTGVFIKLRSTAKKITQTESDLNIDNLQISVIDERYEDCCNYLYGEFSERTSWAFIYERTSEGVERPWADINLMDNATFVDLKNQLTQYGAANWQGKQVFGLYRSSIDASGERTLQFNVSNLQDRFYKPLQDSEIIIKYDESKPIKVFGGDSYVGETIFAAFDTSVEAWDDAYKFDRPLISNKFQSLNQHRTWHLDDVEISGPSQEYEIKYVRQLLYSTILESKINLALDYEAEVGDGPFETKFYPETNYILRPGPFDDLVAEWAGAPAAYKAAFPNEDDYWYYGGFRFLPQGNVDYLHQLNTTTYIQKPTTGYTEISERPNRTVYSVRSEIYGSQNFREFLSSNYYDLTFAGGDIMKAISIEGQGGDNLYLMTRHGVVILLIDKQLISSVSGDPSNLILASDENLVKAEYWVSKNIGVSDKEIKSVATSNDSIYFVSDDDVFIVKGSEIADIDGTYYRKLKELFLNSISYRGAFDWENDHYLLQVEGVRDEMLAFSKAGWIGYKDFRYDEIVSFKGGMHGVGSRYNFMEARTFNVGVGTKINNQTIRLELTAPFVAQSEYPSKTIIPYDAIKSWKRIRVGAGKDGSNVAPEFTYFYKDFAALDSSSEFSRILAEDYKNYGNFEAWIKDAKDNSGNNLIIKIVDYNNIDYIDFISIQFNKK